MKLSGQSSKRKSVIRTESSGARSWLWKRKSTKSLIAMVPHHATWAFFFFFMTKFSGHNVLLSFHPVDHTSWWLPKVDCMSLELLQSQGTLYMPSVSYKYQLSTPSSWHSQQNSCLEYVPMLTALFKNEVYFKEHVVQQVQMHELLAKHPFSDFYTTSNSTKAIILLHSITGFTDCDICTLEKLRCRIRIHATCCSAISWMQEKLQHRQLNHDSRSRYKIDHF